MRRSLAQAKNAASGIAQAVGIPACDARFTALLNRAQERAADAGKWWGTYKRLRVCVLANCITWPREVKAVEAFNQCGLGLPVRNSWYEFQENVYAPNADSCACAQSQLLDRGNATGYRDLAGPSKIRIYPTSNTDIGKKVLLQGLDANGIPIRTLDGAVWVDGVYLTLAYPFATTTTVFKNPGLTGVQKPITNARLTVFGVLAIDDSEVQIAIWEPSEENPNYRRSYLTQLGSRCSSTDCEDEGDGCSEAITNCSNIVADTIVRMECIPALVDSDWLFISNLTALGSLMKAIQKEDKNQYDLAEQEIQRALRALRNELDAYSPPQQFRVNIEIMGAAPLTRVFGGFV